MGRFKIKQGDGNFKKVAWKDEVDAVKTYVDEKIKTDVPANAEFTDTVTPIVDNLTSVDVDKALSAQQGKVLKDELAEHKEEYVQQRQQDNLKVATVEKGLNDYKSTMATINPNQEVKQKVTGYGTISLPKNSANGQANISLKGNTITDETGTKSTISASRLTSVGKNIADLKDSILKQPSLLSLQSYQNKQCVSFVAGSMVSQLRLLQGRFKANTQYIITGLMAVASSDANLQIRYTDGTGKIMNINNTTFQFRTLISDSGKTIDYISGTWNANQSVYLDVDTFIVTEGTVATPYEPYKENLSYIPNIGELRSLPNGTKDEVRVSGNKAELIKRIDKYIFNGNESYTVGSVEGNDDVLRFSTIKLDSLIIRGLLDRNNVYCDKLPVGSNGGTNKQYISTFNDLDYVVRFIILKSSLATPDVAGFIKWLQSNPVTLTYQLAEPIVTPINVSGNLISYPSGTIYVENVVADAGIYTTKFDIKELQLPIKSIDKLIKYNFTTGVQTVLNTGLAVINADKKSFTHPGLTNKDMVFVDYFYDVESTLGETTIEYLDSRHTIKDTTNNKFYKWDIKSTNGVPTVTLTEVL